MKIIKIISEWGKKSSSRRVQADGKTPMTPVPNGHKRVQAIVSFGGEYVTRHIIVKN